MATILKNLNMIAAITEQTRAIGKNGKMIYHIPEDLEYFRLTTEGHTVIMGYNTYLSLPKKPLSNRKNIVITSKNIKIEGCEVFRSLEEVLGYVFMNQDEKIFVIGGEVVYKQLFPYANKLILTIIKESKTVDADTFFPDFRSYEWIEDGTVNRSVSKDGDILMVVRLKRKGVFD